jgi:hypothetical protein
VTASNIAKIPFAPLGSPNDGRPRTVKKIPGADSKSALTEDLVQQIGPGRAHEDVHFSRKNTDRRRQPLIHHLKRLPISAVFQLRYL